MSFTQDLNIIKPLVLLCEVPHFSKCSENGLVIQGHEMFPDIHQPLHPNCDTLLNKGEDELSSVW